MIMFIKKFIKLIVVNIAKKINIYPENLHKEEKIFYNSVEIKYSPQNDIVKRRWLCIKRRISRCKKKIKN